MRNPDRPKDPNEPYGVSQLSYNQRRAKSLAGEMARKQKLDEQEKAARAEWARQQSLPTLDVKVNILIEVVSSLCAMITPQTAAEQLLSVLENLKTMELRTED